MAKLTKIIRSTDLVSETDANAVFELLIPIVEETPRAPEVVETVSNVITRCPLSDERLLSHVLDWWYVATTGQPTANGGAHRLPASLNSAVRLPMEAVVSLETNVPAAEWIYKKQQLDSELNGLDNALKRGDYGIWSLLGEHLNDTVSRLEGNRRTEIVAIEWRDLQQALRDKGVDGGSRHYKQSLKMCRQVTDKLNQIVELQGEVEPWTRRPPLQLINDVPSEFKHAVGPLAEALLRPILAPNATPVVVREKIAEGIDAAGRSGDSRGRYKLARVIDEWCERTGQTIPSLKEELARHRQLVAGIAEIKAKSNAPDDALDEIKIHMLDDRLGDAEEALGRLREQNARDEQAQIAKSQLEGLRRSLHDSSYSSDPVWIARVADIEDRLGTDNPYDMAREIGKAQRELSEQLDELFKEQQEDLRQFLDTFSELRASDSIRGVWERRISELEGRDGRGANELKQELEEELKKLRDECREALSQDLEQIETILRDEREDFSDEDIGFFANKHSEMHQWSQEELGDKQLADARQSAKDLLHNVEDLRIHRWQVDHGEEALVEHLINYCTGALDFDHVDIRRLYVSLKTRPFVILAGLTGSGKSSLTRSFAEALGARGSNGRFRRIAVRPDWIDQSEVLGFVNPISDRFVPGWLAETIRDCEREPDRLHFVLLDEMNLAPVEQYLAEWLSAIEEARSGSDDVRIPLYSSALEPTNANEWSSSVSFPDNLMIVGTVNVDETTRPLSERVLDRANVLLLNVDVSDKHHKPNGAPSAPWHVEMTEWRKLCTNEPTDDHHEFLIEIADILRQASIGVGLRAHLELERFVANAKEIIDDETALDWGIVQRIIPKIRGFKRHLEGSLEELLEEFSNVGAEQSASIVRRWLDDGVSHDEFLEGTDPRLALARITKS